VNALSVCAGRRAYLRPRPAVAGSVVERRRGTRVGGGSVVDLHVARHVLAATVDTRAGEAGREVGW